MNHTHEQTFFLFFPFYHSHLAVVACNIYIWHLDHQFHGPLRERQRLEQEEALFGSFDVLVTTFGP